VNTFLLIIGTVVLTSVLSGVLGMAGGLVLMAVLVTVQPVATAMVVHGIVQAAANGSRALFLLRHVHWPLLVPYVAGALVALGLFSVLAVVPEEAVVLIVIGSFPWLARAVPHLSRLDITQPATAVVSGVVVTATQLFAGVSGPLLDVFYVNARLNRFQVIASKALTQTIGHAVKIFYYGLLIGHTEQLPAWFLITAVVAAVAGTRMGTWLVVGLTDANFRRITGWVILTIGALCIGQGLRQIADI
jgi:uncharacterized protein